jgi:trimeric autotransporter adhesin
MALRSFWSFALCCVLFEIGCGGSPSGSGSGGGGGGTSPQSAVIVSISPTSAQAGASTTTLVVTGSKFASGAVVTFNGNDLSTTYTSSTSLSAVIPASSLTSGETAEIAAVNPGTAPSTNLPFLVDSPTPVLTSVSPSSIAAGNSGTFTLTGSGFEPNSTVQLNGATVTSTFVNTTSLAVSLTATQLTQATTVLLAVVNPPPAGGTSAALNVPVTQLVPVLTSLSPNNVLAGSGAITLTLTGSDFSPLASVTVNGNAVNITTQSSTSITVAVPASVVAQGGVLSVFVTNSGANSQNSNSQNLVIVGTPSVSSLSPGGAGIGGSAFALTVNGNNFTPSSVINWNGTPLPTTDVSVNQLTATVPPTNIAALANDTVTVSTPYAYPTAGVLTSTGQAFSTYVSLANNAMAYNPKDGYLYVSVPSSVVGKLGNCIVAIDPVTGNITRQIPVGSNPNQIAISDDGTQLFVGLDGAASVQQVDLTTGQAGNQFYLGGGNGIYVPPFTAAGLAVLPGEPNSVAVLDNSADIRIFDSGVARSETSGSSLDGYFYQNLGSLAFGSSASTLYANVLPDSGIYELSIGSTGVLSTQSLANSSAGGEIQYDSGRLYVPNGTVLDASTGTLLGTFSVAVGQNAYGPIVSDSTLGLAFVANNGGPSGSTAVLAFNESSFNPTGSIPLYGGPGFPSTFSEIVRWGQDGLAVNTPTQIYVLQSPVVKDVSSSPADVGVTLNVPAAATTGSSLTWTATITNNGPNQAQGVTLLSTLADSVTVQSVSSTQGSCATGNAIICDVGTLANGATATLTVTVIPSVSGSVETTATISSVSYDPSSANNMASASTSVSGSLYSNVPTVSGISPGLVQAGSLAFTLTVTGTGFNASSTVQINGVSQPSTLLSSTQVTAAVDAAAVANYGWAAVTVSNPSPGGGVSNVTPLTIYTVANVPANEIAFDPFTRKIYAVLPSSSSPLTGNSIVAVDPTTGNVGTPINVGSEPNFMAETSDGDYLYIGLSGADSLAQFNLVTQNLQATIPMLLNNNPIQAYGLAALPGSDTTLAVDTENQGLVAIFDVSGSTGAFRPNEATVYTGNDPVFASPTELYTYDNATSGAEFYRFSVTSQGVTEIDGTTLNGLGGFTANSFVLANGTVYGSAGAVINPTTTPPSQVALLSIFGMQSVAVAADPATAKEFMVLEQLGGSPPNMLWRYDLNRYVAETQLSLPVPTNSIGLGYDILCWGQDGLALRVYNGPVGNVPTQILLLRGPFVLPSELNANAIPVLSGTSQTSIPVNNGNITLTLRGSGFLPGAVALWNGVPRTTTFTSSSQLSVAIAAADVASAGSNTLTVQNPGTAASDSLTITVH